MGEKKVGIKKSLNGEKNWRLKIKPLSMIEINFVSKSFGITKRFAFYHKVLFQLTDQSIEFETQLQNQQNLFGHLVIDCGNLVHCL